LESSALPAASAAPAGAEPSLPGWAALLLTEPARVPGGLPAAVLAAAVGVALPLLELLSLLATAGSLLSTSSAALQEHAATTQVSWRCLTPFLTAQHALPL
jgi:hypothetical protein